MDWNKNEHLLKYENFKPSVQKAIDDLGIGHNEKEKFKVLISFSQDCVNEALREAIKGIEEEFLND